MNEANHFQSRIDYQGDLAPVYERVCKAYHLKQPTKIQMFPLGLQDFNVYIEIGADAYLLKIFTKRRDLNNCQRYVDIIQHVISAGLRHPPLYADCEGSYLHIDSESELRMILLKIIPGQTFYELIRTPNNGELKDILEQTLKIHQLPYAPEFNFDSWAIQNLLWMFEKTKQYIDLDGLALVQQVVNQFKLIDLSQLTKCFIHGDVIKSNTILAPDGNVWIIDFAVSNTYPKIQELAVIAANLLNDRQTSLEDRVALVSQTYLSVGGSLNEYELKSLYAYSLAGLAMGFMGSYHDRYLIGDRSPEIDYWMNLGRKGLQAALFKA